VGKHNHFRLGQDEQRTPKENPESITHENSYNKKVSNAFASGQLASQSESKAQVSL